MIVVGCLSPCLAGCQLFASHWVTSVVLEDKAERVHNKVISGFQAIRRARTPVTGRLRVEFEPTMTTDAVAR
ncbi:hypothetical protein PoB_006849800 [Plakobranchus ocellatus]|uniref:Secreted protein n=1 Tax=Plakobranchus ocellatus TaxID=259542 RepID=A0AAV4DD66_9GAST|nr:hypothetical protein PoB_006849800 [Plakobranchus ocellatus]